MLCVLISTNTLPPTARRAPAPTPVARHRFNRQCIPRCPRGAWDRTPDAATMSCVGYTVCSNGAVEITAPTAVSDRACSEPELDSTRCGDNQACSYDGLELGYRGSTNMTLSGRTCQRWTSQEPHVHTRTPVNYPNNGIGDHNYCRNPDSEHGGSVIHPQRLPPPHCSPPRFPRADAVLDIHLLSSSSPPSPLVPRRMHLCRPWCYTTDNDRTWEHCNVCRAYTDAAGRCQSITTDCELPSFETDEPTWSSDRLCGRNDVQCGADDYEIVPFTASTDRECRPAARCEFPTLYEVVALTETTDRTCARTSEPCGADQFELAGPTTTSDRQCRRPRPDCPAGQGTAVEPTATSDRECAPCIEGSFAPSAGTGPCLATRQCDPAEFAATASTPTSDVVCQALTTCTWNEFAAVAPTATSDRGSCTPLSECAPGTEESEAPTDTSDRICTACAEEFFKATPGHRATCEAATECSAGTEFESQAPTAATDRQCTTVAAPCGSGQYESAGGTATTDRVCSAVVPCSSGTYAYRPATGNTGNLCVGFSPPCAHPFEFESRAPSPAADRQCTPVSECTRLCTNSRLHRSGMPCVCPSNCQTCSAAGTCEVCKNGMALLDGQCVGDCAVRGTHVVIGTAQLNRRCCPTENVADCARFQQPSAEEQFESQAPIYDTDRQCASVSTGCSDGEFEELPSTTTADITCSIGSACPVGQYEISPPMGTVDRVCEAVTECSQGHYTSTVETATTNRQCSACTLCDASTHHITRACAGTDDTQCSGCTDCADGEYVQLPCNLIRDNICSACTRCDPGNTFVQSACGFMQDTECSQCATCGSDQYVTNPCSEFSDTRCSDLSPRCVANQEYEVIAPDTSTDRQCDPITDCTADEFLILAFSSTSNNVCQPTSRCAYVCDQNESPYGACQCSHGCINCMNSGRDDGESVCTRCSSGMVLDRGICAYECELPAVDTVDDTHGRHCHVPGTAPSFTSLTMEFEISPPTEDSDRQCGIVRRCGRNEFALTSASATSNTVCQQFRECTRDQYEAWPATATTDRVCLAISPTCDFPTEFEATANTMTSDRICQLVRGPCAGNEFAIQPESPVSDRECAPVTACEAGVQFQTAGPTPFSDRICAAIELCTASQFELTPPTSTSDRACVDLTLACGADHFEARAPTSTLDRVCQAVTACAGNEYEETAPTAVADRRCQALTICAAQAFESRVATSTSDRHCSALRACRSDEFEVTAPTEFTDRICGVVEVCHLGSSYETGAPTATSNRVCSPTSPCVNVEYEAVAPTLTSDRVCRTTVEGCTPEFWESAPPSATSDRSCLAATVCVSNEQFESVALSEFADRTCTELTSPCDRATASLYESRAASALEDRECSPLTLCTADEFESTAPGPSNNRECSAPVACTDLLTFESAAPTTTTDRICSHCTACDRSEYMASACTAESDTHCVACTTSCSASGWMSAWMSAPCSDTRNSVCTECTECSDSQYQVTPCAAYRNAVCVQVAECMPSEYELAAPTATSDRRCALRPLCASGSYQVSPGDALSSFAPHCERWNECDDSHFESSSPSTMDDRGCASCSTCPDGEYVTSECTASSDTACARPSNCDDRCEVRGDMCHEVQMPCASYESSSSCPARRCTFDGEQCSDAPAAVTQFSCQIFSSASDCPRDHACAWDLLSSTCRDQECDDVYTESECAELGCTYEADLFYCHPPGSVVPCSRRYHEVACTTLDDRCRFDDASATCLSLTNCEELQGGADECNAVTGCSYDEVAGYCRDRTESTPCARFSTDSCPTAGAEYAAVDVSESLCLVISECSLTDDSEYELNPPTSSSDRECAAVTACTDDQFIAVPHTGISDRTCQVGTACGIGEFESLPLSAEADRECAPTYDCTAQQFMVEDATPTTDRVCQDLTECSMDTYFYSVLETPTSDRECQTIQPVCTEFDLMQSRGPTPSSDRACDASLELAMPGMIRTYNRWQVPLNNSVYAELTQSGVAWSLFRQAFERQVAIDFQGATAVVMVTEVGRDGEDALLIYYRVLTAADRATDVNNFMMRFDSNGAIQAELAEQSALFIDMLLGQPECQSSEFLDLTAQREGYRFPVCTAVRAPCTFLRADAAVELGPASEEDGSGLADGMENGNVVELYYQFELQAPGITANRICQDVTPVCNQAAAFQSVEPTPFSDRVCPLLTVCSDAEFASVVPTYTSDRECQVLTVCDADPQAEFASVEPTTISNRICQPTRGLCEDGTFEFAAPTAVSDRDCRRCEDKCSLALAPDATSPVNFLSGSCLDPIEEDEGSTEDPDGVCTRLTVCHADTEYEAVAATFTSDRECAPLTVCSTDEFISRLKTETADRQCTPILSCNGDEYESTAPTETSDRSCTAISGWCRSGQYIGIPATATSDRGCLDHSGQCLASTEWEVSAPGRTSDRECRTVTTCVSGQFQEAQRSLTSDRICSGCSMCEETAFIGQACTIAQDTRCNGCTVCGANQYAIVPCSLDADAQCTQCRTCGSGYFVSAACHDAQNTDCTRCTTCGAEEFYVVGCSQDADAECAAWTECSADTYECAPPSIDANRQCCAVTECGAAEYTSVRATATEDTVCAALTTCTETEFELRPPAEDADRHCGAVTNCDYSAEYLFLAATDTSDAVCLELTVCTDAEYQEYAPTDVTDRVCQVHPVCSTREYQSRAGTMTSPRRCRPLTVCNAGEEDDGSSGDEDDASQDTQVLPLLATRFEETAATDTSDRICRNLTFCTPAQWQSTAPSVTSDRICTALTSCTSSQYQSQMPTDTSDSVCSPTTQCNSMTNELQVVCEYCVFGQLEDTDCGNALATFCAPAVEPYTGVMNICELETRVQNFNSWKEASCDQSPQYEAVQPSYFADRICQRVTECNSSQVEQAAPTDTSDRTCVILVTTTALPVMVDGSTSENNAEASATPWWIIMVIIFGVLTAVAVVAVYARQGAQSQQYNISGNPNLANLSLPYSVSGLSSVADHSMQINNMSYDGNSSFAEKSHLGSTLQADNGLKETDPTDWLLGTVPLSGESGAIRLIQAKHLQSDINNGPARFGNVPIAPRPPTTKSGSSGGPISQGALLDAHMVEFPAFPDTHRFITCRQPDTTTVGGFWQMVWDHEVEVVASIPNLSSERFSFFRDAVGGTAEFVHENTISITLLKMHAGDGFIHREFNVLCDGQRSRLVQQIEFTEWGDSGTPQNTTAFGMFTESVAVGVASGTSQQAPVLVHCRDGVGASGALILVSIMAAKLKQGMVPDPETILQHCRGQRQGCIATAAEYDFALKSAEAFLRSMSPPQLTDY